MHLRYILLSSCWDESPEKRPRFERLVESFGNITTNWRSSVVSDSSKLGDDEDELHLSYEQLYSDFSGDSDNSMTAMCSDSLGARSRRWSSIKAKTIPVMTVATQMARVAITATWPP